MITVYPVLRQRMKDYGITGKELAVATDIRPVAFYLKMWGIKRWKLTEAVKICCFFRTPDAERLFVWNYNKQQFMESQEEISNEL